MFVISLFGKVWYVYNIIEWWEFFIVRISFKWMEDSFFVYIKWFVLWGDIIWGLEWGVFIIIIIGYGKIRF